MGCRWGGGAGHPASALRTLGLPGADGLVAGSHGAGRFKTFRKRDAELKMNVAKKQKFSRVSQVAKTRKKGNSVKARNHKKGKGKVRKSGKNKINDKNNKISKWRSSKKKRKIRKTLTVQKMKQTKKQFQGKSPKERLLARNNDPNNCTALWAKLTNFGLRAASSIKKQAKSTQNNDRITESKRSKGEEYNEHKDILVQALDSVHVQCTLCTLPLYLHLHLASWHL